jgi:hypothetical protein
MQIPSPKRLPGIFIIPPRVVRQKKGAKRQPWIIQKRVRVSKNCSGWLSLGISHLVLEDDVQGVDDSWNVTEDGQEDVDEEVGIATTFQKHTDGRNEDGEDDLDDV